MLYFCRFCSFEGANENVWHILDVQPNSPAAHAGLRSDTDYIIGADSVLNEVHIILFFAQFNNTSGLLSDNWRRVLRF